VAVMADMDPWSLSRGFSEVELVTRARQAQAYLISCCRCFRRC
jgi:hypothetical protein